MKIDNLELSKNIDHIEFKDRFFLFEKKNFLDQDIYTELKNNFPPIEIFSKHNDFARSLSDENDNFSTFLEKNLAWKNFVSNMNSKTFAEDLINFFDLKNVYFDENSWKKRIKIFKKVKLSFCFNISEEGGFSLPHTDSSRKLVSMVLFFVDDIWNENNGGQVNLYKPLNRVFENNWRNERVDKDKLEIIKTIIPSPNKIYGFKKTKNSYHSVEKVKPMNYLKRKVFMVNLIYENKSDSPYQEKRNIFEKVKDMIKVS